MSEICIETARPSELLEIAHVLSIAITPTLNSIALWGGKSEKHRQRIEKALYLIYLLNPSFKTLVARHDDKIVGVHSMLPWPNCQPSFREAIRMTPRLLPVMGMVAVRGIIMQSKSSRLDPREQHWHLGPIGVLPGERGRGIGKQLVTEALKEFDQDGIPAYLETDQLSIVKQEEQLGFRVIGETKILGVPNWLMWRNPQQN